jgi:hypothetical protein
VPVRWKGAHHSGLAVVRGEDDGWTMVTGQTGGRQRSFEGRSGARHGGDTPGRVGESGDGRRWATIGGATWTNGGGRELVTGAWRSSRGRRW